MDSKGRKHYRDMTPEERARQRGNQKQRQQAMAILRDNHWLEYQRIYTALIVEKGRNGKS